jgi:rSAM/selenodomain-associated transferase 2
MHLSIIMPTLNEAAGIVPILERLQPLRARGAELIVVDGGSNDDTVALAAPRTDWVITHERGRAAQMNAGARVARGDAFLFLHADSVLPGNADTCIREALADRRHAWGRFDVTIDGHHVMLPLIAWFMNHRSRLSGIATGDQGIFVTREAFIAASGFPDQALMEDVAFSTRMLKTSKPFCVASRISTSGRRWEKHGVWRTIILMWRLRWNYYRGADPSQLHRLYYREHYGK